MTAKIEGIHHVKFPVSDLARSRAWYERVLGLDVTHEFPDADGVVRGVAGAIDSVPVALRVQEAAAAGLAGFDPVCFSIADRAAADAWIARLDELGVEHSPLFEATTGWMVRCTDPDGTEIRLYSLAKDDGVDHTGEQGYAQRVR
ncbi:VOC family protein [Amycolatopsis sp. CA-126428]|uniref:VOC family protein n=1 Tax=Amycolatopsis sp. CA-126428 TaxID=2073158 RepID=UPI000CD2956A|nr:VOC family protein [Amycolatopsis sp. CA-126428]